MNNWIKRGPMYFDSWVALLSPLIHGKAGTGYLLKEGKEVIGR